MCSAPKDVPLASVPGQLLSRFAKASSTQILWSIVNHDIVSIIHFPRIYSIYIYIYDI